MAVKGLIVCAQDLSLRVSAWPRAVYNHVVCMVHKLSHTVTD